MDFLLDWTYIERTFSSYLTLFFHDLIALKALLILSFFLKFTIYTYKKVNPINKRKKNEI